MQRDTIYSNLGYDKLLISRTDLPRLHPDYRELTKIGADKVYFSGDQPAVLFVDIQSFSNSEELERIAQIQHNAWNYRKVLLLYVVSDVEIRIYNCHAKPLYFGKNDDISQKLEPAELFSYNSTSNDVNNLNILVDLFSRIGVDSGSLWSTEQSEIRDKIDLQNRVDAYLVKSLTKTSERLQKEGLDKRIIHSLLMRSLFILFLEDKGAAKETNIYRQIKADCSSYFDILDSREATYGLFNELQIHFNGDITYILPDEKDYVTDAHLQIIKRCFTDGNISDNRALFENWRLFNFEIIQIELLSEIYEHFLGALKKVRGQYYTPYNLVELILSDKLSVNSTNYNIKVLDPACGSGIFLVESYKRLVKRWKRANNTDRISFGDLKEILLNNIFGVEIDETAIKVAAFSLYLALVDELDPKTLWIENDYQLPYLIFDSKDTTIEHQGCNLLRKDTIGEVNPNDLPQIDLVVGNPPFGTKQLPPIIKEYCTHHKFAKEYILPFIHKSTQFCSTGEIALIFNAKVLTNSQKPYQIFREWLFNNNNVEKIYNLSIFRKTPENFGGQLFTSAVGPVSIVYFSPLIPNNQPNTIEYWAPKTYVKSGLISGVIIDSSDVKYLPRIECQNPSSKIWKTALWGNVYCEKILRRAGEITLEQFFRNNNIICKTGLHGDKNKQDFKPEYIIQTKRIDRYYTESKNAIELNDKHFRSIDKALFTPPFVLFKEGQKDGAITCSLFDEDYYCANGAYVINGTDFSLSDKKLLIAYLNSDVARFFLFMITSTWGVERERVLLNELLELPSPFTASDSAIKDNIVIAYDQIAALKKEILINSDKIEEIEADIFTQLCQLFSFSEKDIIVIKDMLKYNLGLFEDGWNSIALRRTLLEQSTSYAETLCGDINSFLHSSSTRVSAKVYDVKLNDQLNLVVLHFSNRNKNIEIGELAELKEQLKEINKYTIKEKAPNIYIQKNIKYYLDDTVYIIKPNQQRFWTQTQAMEDASSLIADIINMAE